MTAEAKQPKYLTECFQVLSSDKAVKTKKIVSDEIKKAAKKEGFFASQYEDLENSKLVNNNRSRTKKISALVVPQNARVVFVNAAPELIDFPLGSDLCILSAFCKMCQIETKVYTGDEQCPKSNGLKEFCEESWQDIGRNHTLVVCTSSDDNVFKQDAGGVSLLTYSLVDPKRAWARRMEDMKEKDVKWIQHNKMKRQYQTNFKLERDARAYLSSKYSVNELEQYFDNKYPELSKLEIFDPITLDQTAWKTVIEQMHKRRDVVVVTDEGMKNATFYKRAAIRKLGEDLTNVFYPCISGPRIVGKSADKSRPYIKLFAANRLYYIPKTDMDRMIDSHIGLIYSLRPSGLARVNTSATISNNMVSAWHCQDGSFFDISVIDKIISCNFD